MMQEIEIVIGTQIVNLATVYKENVFVMLKNYVKFCEYTGERDVRI